MKHMYRRFALGLSATLSVAAVLAACGGHGGVRQVQLTLPFPLGTLSAEGDRVAVGPAVRDPQLGPAPPLPLVVWNARSGRVARFSLPRPCADPWGTSLAGSRVGVVCDQSCCDTVDQRVTVVGPTGPPLVVAHTCCGFGVKGSEVGGLAGSGKLLAFSLDTVDARGNIVKRALLRIDGRRIHQIAGGRLAGNPVAAAGGQLVVRTPEQLLRILDAEGRQIGAFVSFTLGPDITRFVNPALAFDGSIVYENDVPSGDLVREPVALRGLQRNPPYQIGPGRISRRREQRPPRVHDRRCRSCDPDVGRPRRDLRPG
jgi:hypothetical protein